jgi:hypothetical protein
MTITKSEITGILLGVIAYSLVLAFIGSALNKEDKVNELKENYLSKESREFIIKSGN